MTPAELCSDYHFLEGIRLIKYFITIAKIFIPIILIAMGSYDLFKSLINVDANDLKKQLMTFSKRIASAAIIFLLPTIITIAFSLVTNVSSFANLISVCSNNASKENIAHLKVLTKQRIEANKKLGQNYEIVYEKSNYVLQRAKQNELNGISSGGGSDLYSFVMQYEGHEGYCDDSKTTYKAVDIGDGAVTIGYGVTNHVMNVSVGDCIDTNTVDNYFMDNIDAIKLQVEKEVNTANISEWDDAKTTAVTSIGYNCGFSYAKKVIQGYASGGNDGALRGFKSCTKAANGNDAFTQGLIKRRDGEYELFLTGNYETGFTNRNEIKYIK